MNSSPPLPHDFADRLLRLGRALIDQDRAQVLVKPQQPHSGFWFGGGNVIRDVDGSFLMCGRYRNAGDSRTGVGAGERGLELALFRATDPMGPFQKVRRFSKADLACGGEEVVSIEGAALARTPQGLELFVSTEKAIPYPERIRAFQKPGAGVWTIDHMVAGSVDALDASALTPLLRPGSPERLHVKDPVALPEPDGGLTLVYCTHPFSWSSSGTAVAHRPAGEGAFALVTEDLLKRGAVWDIAAARVTSRLHVPSLGAFADQPPQSLFFYDSCECLRPMEDHATSVKRPRGYSCEEIGGMAWGADAAFPEIASLTVEAPLFVSPHGTGCSRYIDTCVTEEGILATWQQSQTDFSQPLVGHFLPNAEIRSILGA